MTSANIRQKGQALLIILLVMAVVLTIALSVVSRSVTDISISQKEQEAARAYSAAEAGVERTLLSGSAITSGSLPDVDGEFETRVSSLAQGGSEYNIPLLMSSGETVPVWLLAHDQDGNTICDDDNPCFTGNELMFCWGEKGTNAGATTTPALEMSILYTSTSDPSSAKIARAAFDPYVTRPESNNFEKGSDGNDCIIEGKEFEFKKTIQFSDFNPVITIRSSGSDIVGPQIIRLRLLYNTDRAHPVGIRVIGDGSLPKQGNKIEADGRSGESERSIEVFQLYPDLPPVFDYGIFAGSGGITKQ